MPIKHPDYDIDFKPAIARFDWDQTYDVLEFVYLPQGFDQLMDLCGIPCFELMAIDRFTPYRYRWADQYSDEVYEFLKNFNFSPHNSIIERFLRDEANQFIFNLSGHPRWENEWVSANSYAIEDVVTYNGTFYQCTTANSDTNFTTSKWKLLTYRNYSWSNTRLRKFDYIFYWDIISNISAYYVAITDNAYLKPPIEGDVKNTSEWIEISLTVPKFELKNTQVYNYEPILANFTEGKYQITGLIYQGSQEGLTGSIPTINQTFAEFTLAESTEIDINQILWNRWLKDDYFPDNNTNRFCSNSLVISKLSNGNWVDYTPSFTDKPTWLLYSDINTYFNNVKQQLINYFQNIYDGFIDNVKLFEVFEETYSYSKNINFIFPDIFPLQSYIEKIIQNVSAKINFKTVIDNSFIPYPNWDNREDLSLAYVMRSSDGELLADVIGYGDYEPAIIFSKFPDYFINDCYLARANNNKWSMQTNYGDLGDIPDYINQENHNYAYIYAVLNNLLETELEQKIIDVQAEHAQKLKSEVRQIPYDIFPLMNRINFTEDDYLFYEFSTVPFWQTPPTITHFCFKHLITLYYPSGGNREPHVRHLYIENPTNKIINNYGFNYLKKIKQNKWFRHYRHEGGQDKSYIQNANLDYSHLIGSELNLINNTGKPFTAIVDKVNTYPMSKTQFHLIYNYIIESNLYDYNFQNLEIERLDYHNLSSVAISCEFEGYVANRTSVDQLINEPTNQQDYVLNFDLQYIQEIYNQAEFTQIKQYIETNSLKDNDALDYLLQLKEQYEEMSKTW